MIEIRHLYIRHFVIEECSHLVRLHNQMWLHQFDVILLSVMSWHKNMRNKHYRMHAESVTL